MRIDPMDRVNSIESTQKLSPAKPHVVRAQNHVNEDEQVFGSTKIEDTLDDLRKALEKVRTFLKAEAQFTIDRELNMIIIKIKNVDTGEIIRQIPPEVAVKIAKNLQELIGVLFDERV